MAANSIFPGVWVEVVLEMSREPPWISGRGGKQGNRGRGENRKGEKEKPKWARVDKGEREEGEVTGESTEVDKA